jgi:hypothetical protein
MTQQRKSQLSISLAILSARTIKAMAYLKLSMRHRPEAPRRKLLSEEVLNKKMMRWQVREVKAAQSHSPMALCIQDNALMAKSMVTGFRFGLMAPSTTVKVHWSMQMVTCMREVG